VNSDCSMFPDAGVTAMPHGSLRATGALRRSANDAPTSVRSPKPDAREIALPLARQVSREMGGLDLSGKTAGAPAQEVKERAAHAPHLAQ
jgi:hypothetical protein